MALRHVRAFGSDFDVVVERDSLESGPEQLRATVLSGGEVIGTFAFRNGDVLKVRI